MIVDETGTGRRIGPACTDNFQVRSFTYGGIEFHSCEQAFQSLKFVPGNQRDRICRMKPMESESDSSFGMRCWSEGRSGPSYELRKDWDAVKVGVMLAVNEAKYKQNADLARDLLATGNATIVGASSTSWSFKGNDHNWARWNGLIQMRLREELRPPETRAPGVLEALIAQFDAYASEGRAREREDE
jgi:predicted NAD-dependent protein-ADP-ribosyltransferase YbiA (DUF1768 family)